MDFSELPKYYGATEDPGLARPATREAWDTAALAILLIPGIILACVAALVAVLCLTPLPVLI